MKSTLPHVVMRVSTQQQCDDNVEIKDASHVISDLELDFTRIKKSRYMSLSFLKYDASLRKYFHGSLVFKANDHADVTIL
jgi:hypothetical protein